MEMKITITIDGKDITLPLDKAKELHGELDKIFGSKNQPYPAYPSAPVFPPGIRDVCPEPPWTVTCEDTKIGSYRNIPKGL